MKKKLALACLLAGAVFAAKAQTSSTDTTVRYSPVPKVVTPGRAFIDPPSDAIVLFDGKNLDEWVSGEDRSKPAGWDVHDGIVTVNKSKGDIQTRRSFGNYQLHIEWRIPADIQGSGQERGNSGVFLGAFGNEKGYELQVLDAYKNPTYVDGMAGAIYRQYIPLVNPSRKPGQWQSYDVIWTAPIFNKNGTIKTPAYATVFYNGVLVQNHVAIQGPTWYEGHPKWVKHGRVPIALQAHGDDSKPISYRNIWIRELN